MKMHLFFCSYKFSYVGILKIVREKIQIYELCMVKSNYVNIRGTLDTMRI